MQYPPSRLRFTLSAVCLALAGAACSPSATAQVAVLTQNNDIARTGANPAETELTPGAINTTTFGKLFTISGLGANVNGQALYAPNVLISGLAHNAIIAYTSNNSNNSPCGLSAYDADTGALLWSTALPPAAQYTTASPVIDPSTHTIYALTKSTDDNGPTYLRAFDITTGSQKGAVQVAATTPGTGDGSYTATSGPYTGQSVVSFDGPSGAKDSHGNVLQFHANDRAGLLLVNGVVYTSFAFNSDAFPYHGWILGYSFDGTNFTQRYVFCTTPKGGDGGIWMAGKGLSADASGNIYCSVGNGTFDAATKGITSGTDYGMCYLKLSPSLTVEDWYAPYDEAAQSNADNDLGNSGPVGIPGTMDIFSGASKFGAGFLLNTSGLGHMPSSAASETAVQRLNGLSGNDDVGQNPVAWDSGSGSYKYVYLWPGGQKVEQFRYDPSAANFNPPTPASNTSSYPGNAYKVGGPTNGGSLAVSSNGTTGAILWAVGNDGVVHAFNATDVSQPEIWNSSTNSSRDSLGSVGHFQFPTVANGKVYVPNGSGGIAVYGLLHQPFFRFYNPDGDHFYTVSPNDEIAASQAGYGLEGVIGYVPAVAASGTTPVYRLYYPPSGAHFYTANASEVTYAVSLGYQNQGPQFQVLTTSGGAATLPLYRFYWPAAGKHFYTTGQAEYNYVLANGFVYEGVVGYLYANP